MSETNNLGNGFWILVGIIAIPILIGLIVKLCLFIIDFSRKLKYVNSEIARTTGYEREYWFYERRRLWCSLIPFVKY